MGEPNRSAYASHSYAPHTSLGARSNYTSPPGHLSEYSLLPDGSEIYRDQYSIGNITTSICPSGLGLPGSHELNYLRIHESAGTCAQKGSIEELAAELERGVTFEAAILQQEGYQCLLRPEYQFQDKGHIKAPLPFQNIDLSPFEPSPPLSSESPDSVLSQDGHEMSLKRFKCSHPGCSYAARRGDHVKDHYRARHLGTKYVCGICRQDYTYKGTFDSHSPCNTKGKELRIQCTLCGATVSKKGLRRHKETRKCKCNQSTLSIN